MAHGNGHKQIVLSSRVVVGLCDLNQQKRSEEFDSVFLKALLIGFYTIKKIKNNEAVDDGISELIKNLFEWRVKASEERVAAFANMVANAINDIKTNNFKA